MKKKKIERFFFKKKLDSFDENSCNWGRYLVAFITLLPLSSYSPKWSTNPITAMAHMTYPSLLIIPQFSREYDLTLPIPQGPHHYSPRSPLLFLKVPTTIQKVCFTSFISGGFITAIVVNTPEKKLAKIISVHYSLRSPKNQFHK